MIPLPPRSTRTYTLCPYATRFRASDREGDDLVQELTARVRGYHHRQLSGRGAHKGWIGVASICMFRNHRKRSDQDHSERPFLSGSSHWSHSPQWQSPSSVVYTGRSEEHTSELQSLMRISYAVFCLKKKNKKIRQILDKP